MRPRAGHRDQVLGRAQADAGFWQALQDLPLTLAFVVAPVQRRYPLAAGVDVLPVWDVAGLLADWSGQAGLAGQAGPPAQSG